MPDLDVKGYEKSVEKITDHWSKKIGDANKQIDSAEKELKKLGVKDPKKEYTTLLKDPDKAKAGAAKKIADAKAEIEKATKSLEVNLKLIEPPPKAPEKDLIKLPDTVKKIIEKKGIPLGKDVVLKPDISFDFKKKKVKKVGIELKWSF